MHLFGCRSKCTTEQTLDNHMVKCEYKGNAFKIRRGQHGDGPEYEPDKPEEPKKEEVGVAEPLETEPQEKPQGNPGESESVVANPPKVTHWLYCQFRRCGASYKTEESRHKHHKVCPQKGNALKKKNRILLFTMLVKPMPEPGEGGYSRSLKTKWKRY
jgi:hypothetical protein